MIPSHFIREGSVIDSAIDHEAALAKVMQGARVFARRVDPGLEHLEHEEIVPRGHMARSTTRHSRLA